MVEGGSIVNFASNSGTFGRENQAPYAAAKEGVRGLSRVAAREWGPQGIRVNVICPFANSPGMLAWSETEPETYAASLETIPLQRIGDCEDDIGRVAVFLASDDAAGNNPRWVIVSATTSAAVSLPGLPGVGIAALAAALIGAGWLDSAMRRRRTST